MKISSLLHSLPLACLAAGLTFLTGCNKSDRSQANSNMMETKSDMKDTMSDTYADMKASASRTWDNIKDYSYDKRDDFKAQAKAASSKMDSEISQVRANYSEAQASASRKAAMAELKDDEADYHQKLDALGNATADTWDSAKKNVMLAWDKLQASYYKARAN